MADDGELRTHVEIPEGAVLLGVVECAYFLNADGERQYGFRWPGEMTYSDVLGVLELVKSQVIKSYNEDCTEE